MREFTLVTWMKVGQFQLIDQAADLTFKFICGLELSPIAIYVISAQLQGWVTVSFYLSHEEWTAESLCTCVLQWFSVCSTGPIFKHGNHWVTATFLLMFMQLVFKLFF